MSKRSCCSDRIERELWAAGYKLVAGVDEAGRGALAGPVVAAAVILNPEGIPQGIDDSKKLSRKRRERLFDQIRSSAMAISVAMVSAAEIDRMNIHAASLKAMSEAIERLSLVPDYVLVDGFVLNTCGVPHRAIIRGDALSVSIAAASIIAKVTRDRLLAEYDDKWPGYGFAEHAGYSTLRHRLAILNLGITPVHRTSFRPVVSGRQKSFDFDEQ
ncbi:MAG: ribonuclease HII [Acidobacteriota bacterium]|nr:ribonuclease HII [Blastocatellia bacterium]MDW8413393.1 ribonuclease HII [Acidobacteriota bacterium]